MTSTKEYVQRDDGTRRANRKRGKRRCRKRLSTLLHTHVALILVCTLAALDSACVIGQIICDILIMKDTLQDWEVLDKNLTSLLWQDLPLLNATGHDDLSALSLTKVRDVLWEHRHLHHSNVSALSSRLAASGIVVPPEGLDPRWLQALQTAAASVSVPSPQPSGSLNVTVPGAPNGEPSNSTVGQMIIGFFKIPVSHSRHRRAAGGKTAEHDLLHDLTHSFHLGSMIILSILLMETLLKVFAMGKKILHHKLEIFDAFVVSVSWALDVAFWEGIWAHPGTEAATILIIILPWRVVRIVNSFVLVIQEKDNVQLKIVKQRLRLSVKKSKESTRKASSYRTEVKQLQGLCRKYGATENEINACGPTGRMGRRRSSLMPAMERAASLTLISALGSHPSLYTMDSSSDEEDVNRDHGDLSRTVSQDPTLRSAYSITTLDSVFTIEGKSHTDDELASDNELDNVSTGHGLDNPVFTNHADNDRARTESLPAPEQTSTPLQGDVESGPEELAHRLHQKLSEQPSVVSVVSVVSEVSELDMKCDDDSGSGDSAGSGGSGAEPAAQEIPPEYHEVVSKQDSNTRL